MGEATPPLECIGLHRDRLPNLTHQIVIITLLELASEVDVAMGVTNRGGCASSRSSGSPLVLGNQKLKGKALLVGRKSRYRCTVEIKPIPPIPAFGRSLFVYSNFWFQGLTSLTSGSGVRALQASTPVPALFTVCGGFRGKGFRGDCLRLFTQ